MRHPLFDVPAKKTFMNSEHRFNTSEKELCALLADFLPGHEEYVAALEGDPESRREYVTLAQVLCKHYRRPEAEPFLRQVVRWYPDEPANYFYLGQIYEEGRDYPAAVRCYERYVALAPDVKPDTNPFFFDIWFFDAQTHAPNTPEALTALGTISLEQFQDVERARECFRRAIDLAPRHFLAPYLPLADLLRDHDGRFAEAFVLYRQAEELFFAREPRLGGYGCGHHGGRYSVRHNYILDAYDLGPVNSLYPTLHTWTMRRYPLAFGNLGFPMLLDRYEQLGAVCYDKAGDYDLAIQCYARVKRMLKDHHFPLRPDVCLKHIDLILQHYRDYWQAEQLCRDALRQEESLLRYQEAARAKVTEAARLRQRVEDIESRVGTKSRRRNRPGSPQANLRAWRGQERRWLDLLEWVEGELQIHAQVRQRLGLVAKKLGRS